MSIMQLKPNQALEMEQGIDIQNIHIVLRRKEINLSLGLQYTLSIHPVHQTGKNRLDQSVM